MENPGDHSGMIKTGTIIGNTRFNPERHGVIAVSSPYGGTVISGDSELEGAEESMSGTYAAGTAQQPPPGMNEEEARLRLAQLQGKQREKFCPWLKEKCREDCASLFRGGIGKRAGEWRVSPPRCQSPMVNGLLDHP